MKAEEKFKSGDTVLVQQYTSSGKKRAPWTGTINGEIRTGVRCIGSVEYLVFVKAPDGPGYWVPHHELTKVN